MRGGSVTVFMPAERPAPAAGRLPAGSPRVIFKRRADGRGFSPRPGVWGDSARTADPAALVRSEWFEVICISAGSDARRDWLSAGIAAVRNASRNRAIGILVGGPSFSLNPDLAALVGADGTAVDAR